MACPVTELEVQLWILIFSRDGEEDMESSHLEESPKELQEKLEYFTTIYPSIVRNDRKLAYSGTTGKSSYVLQATPTIIDTWHEIPMTSSESGSSEDNEVSN